MIPKDYKKFKVTIFVLKFLILLSMLPFIADFTKGFVAGFKGDPFVINLPVQQTNPTQSFINAQPGMSISALEITTSPGHRDTLLLIYLSALTLGIISLSWYIVTIKNSFKALNSLSNNGLWITETTQYIGRAARGLLIGVVSNDLSNYLYQLHRKKSIIIPGFDVLASFEPSYSLLLTGVILVLITWILKFGEQMKLEQDLTI